MHEFSLARSVVDIAEYEVKKAHAKKVTSISLKIGTCVGVEPDAFKFAWQSAVKDSVLEDAERIIYNVEGKAHCRDCHSEFVFDELYDPCPECGSYNKDILQGREFLVESMTVI